MKRPFTIYDLRFTIWKKSGRAVSPLTADGAQRSARPTVQPSAFGLRPSQRGVALVITVILLAVVTLLALTFLAMSRRERGAVTATTDTASARLAADDALASAEAQIVANVLATTNPYNFGLVVSTNYINPAGFIPAVGANPTNVNYYDASGNLLTGNNFLQNLANLYYSPRVPVYATNLIYRTNELQFYLDLNRNGLDDPNGSRPELGNNGLPIVNGGVTNYVSDVGDPEWIGVLQHPDQPYGPNNLFVARYAFIAVPIGNALDLNAIHNEATIRQVNSSSGTVNDGFLRNQGVGSWEINLAAFLADLNTNEWLPNVPPDNLYYAYNEPASVNRGHAFDDALSLLSYRYGYNYNLLATANQLFPNAAGVFPFDNIDGYSDGPLQVTFNTNEFSLQDNSALSWSGADNTNQFFDLQELFNPSETEKGVTPPGFTDRLLNAGNGASTYNRYSYYRLASQMGVESAPEQDKIDLNYANAFAYINTNNGVVTNITFFPGAETNFTLWTPLQFFTIAADKMLREYSQAWLAESPSNFVATFNVTNAFSITNIPVLVSNQFVYTPAVQRVLQLAANIYDATTRNANISGVNFPSVFRPIFLVTNQYGYTNVFVVSYEPVQAPFKGIEQIGAVSGLSDPQLNLPVDVTALAPNFGFGTFTNVNVYGVPWIVGAKKGFPNFNEFAMESVFQLTRKMQVTRPTTNSPLSDYSYNQMFNLSLSNQFGVECWNSYTNDYLRSVGIYVTSTNAYLLTNDEGFSGGVSFQNSGFLLINSANNNNNGWPGYDPLVNQLLSPASFQIPFYTNVAVLPTSMYRFNVGPNVEEPGHIGPYLTTNLNWPFEAGVLINNSPYPQPHWWLLTTNDVRVIILDTQNTPYHVIDYVQLSGPNSARDLTSEIISGYDTQPGPNGNDMWNTNYQNGLPLGLVSQIGVSLGSYTPGLGSDAWNNTDTTLRGDEIDGFRAFFGYGPLQNDAGSQQATAEAAMTNAIQAPYTPTATVVQHVSWQANDPLVHYTADDLNWPGANRLDQSVDNMTNGENIGRLNDRYMPWGGNPILTGADQNPFNLALKDPLVWRSDDWDFPTYELPTVGWLGRVHRGTPWQTVYLKSPDILQQQNAGGVIIGTNTWAQWTGDSALASGQFYDAANTAPVQDRLLFDNFTTAFNDNASRGTLSVNVGASDTNNLQAGLAAWSALLSGVIALSNNAVDATISTNAGMQHANSIAYYTSFPVNPAGPGGMGSVLGQLVANINQTRTNFVNADGLVGTFEHAGDVLATPALTTQSPFLNWNDAAQQANGINDEMYEWLPQQVMSLLRVSGTPQSPVRYVIYSYGQALKPAPNGIYTGGATLANGQSAFGMVTNYQVVAEAATRTVLHFNDIRTDVIGTVKTNDALGNTVTNWISTPVVTNNSAVIERFNVLPAN
ncbi:MAG TPA: hypothetical protein VKU37_03060 [Verrucomicrobiae bacterium]|nr:hypothetical protein [Verrucomicrobiae bacterium]